MRPLSWVTFLGGIWLIIAPFVLRYAVTGAKAEDVILGILIAGFSLASTATFATWLVVLFGAWVIIAPFVLGYSRMTPAATPNDVITGIVVLVLGLIAATTATPMARRAGGPTA